MALSGKPINSDATLNNFEIQDQIEFAPGENLNVALQLYNPEHEQRYVLPSTAIPTFTFNNTDGSTFSQVATFIDAGDRSLLLITLTSVQTANLMSGNISFSIDLLGDGTQIKKGFLLNALRKADLTC